MDIEKNDVDISALFRWNAPVEIKDSSGNILATVYMRLVGDADLNRARVFALRESSKLRKALRTPGTDEHEAFIAQIKDQPKDVLIKASILFQIQDLGDEARREVSIKWPVEPPSTASLEEQEAYQREVDEFPQKFAEAADAILKRKIDEEEKRLNALSEEDLKKEYINFFINYLCQEEMTNKFIEMCVYLGTYKDKKFKTKAFSSFEEFNNAAPELKEQLKKAYGELEIKVPDLKKLPEATP